MRKSSWGPKRESAKTIRQDIREHEFTIERARARLEGGTLSLASSSAAESARHELEERIRKAEAAIARLRVKLEAYA